MQYRSSVIRAIREYLSDRLLRTHRIAGFHRSGRQITVNGNIITMPDEDVK